MDQNKLEHRIHEYFNALDRLDPRAATSCFATDATLTCESDGTHLQGTEQINDFFDQICAESTGMTHTVLNVVIDTDRQTVACELTYRDTLKDGRSYDMRNCNFFDFDSQARFTRVHFWLGAPLE